MSAWNVLPPEVDRVTEFHLGGLEEWDIYVTGNPDRGPLLQRDYDITPLVVGPADEENAPLRDDEVRQNSLERHLMVNQDRRAFDEITKALAGTPSYSEDAHFPNKIQEEHPELVDPDIGELAAEASQEPIIVDYRDTSFEVQGVTDPSELPEFRSPIEHYFFQRMERPDSGEKSPTIAENTLEQIESQQRRLDDFGVEVPPPEKEYIENYVWAFQDVVEVLKDHNAIFYVTGSLARETETLPNDIDIAVKAPYENKGKAEELTFRTEDLDQAVKELTGEEPENLRRRIPGGVETLYLSNLYLARLERYSPSMVIQALHYTHSNIEE